ncbi:hypothetical protein N8D56_15765 [Devosia sp. A8/3-2]|nr:hypothetical protein N8D56_15765 [Devosia sp. A8/3-2]
MASPLRPPACDCARATCCGSAIWCSRAANWTEPASSAKAGSRHHSSLRSETGDGLHYGRLWFLGDAPTPALQGDRNWAAGFGNGGQRLWLMPDAGLAVVTYSGHYNARDAFVTPNRVWREIVLANLVAA